MKCLQYYRVLLTFSAFLVSNNYVQGQCTNAVKFPTTNVTASTFNNNVVVSSGQFAGQYYVVQGLSIGQTYQFSSSNKNDYLTIRDRNGLTLLAHGTTPLSYTISGADIVTVHINVSSPGCGAENVVRKTSVQCTTCPSRPPNVQVTSTLDVNGLLQLGSSEAEPQAGMVRWNSANSDFEGFNGTKWISLTKSNGSWGNLPSSEVQERQKSSSLDGAGGDGFGQSVAISGNYAIVGAWGCDVGANADQGAAYVFVRNGTLWTQQDKITVADGAAGDYFGYSVAISGDYAVICASSDDNGANADQGSAYVFLRVGNSWVYQNKLTASDGGASDFFGASVSIDGDYLVVGAFGDDVGLNAGQGSAYVYFRNGANWLQQKKLTASDGAATDYFGASVSISGMSVIVGADRDDIGAVADQGSAYVFLRTGTNWAQQAKLTASNGLASDEFGGSVAISGDYVVVGASKRDGFTFPNSGASYFFARSGVTWTQQNIVYNPESGSTLFGKSVSISGDFALIGGDGLNAAILYSRNGNTWVQVVKLIASSGSSGKFGIAVSIDGDYLIIADNIATIGANINQGAVYFFNR